MLSAEQIQANLEKFYANIEKFISEPRTTKLLALYQSQEDNLTFAPASSRASYHNAFPGGYVDHVNRVVESAIKVTTLWSEMGATINFSTEELVFSAINHDLGKVGDSTQDLYLPGKDEWRKKNLGEVYSYNNEVAFMTIPDRSLFLLQEAGIKYSLNEMLAIRTHDGLYEESNKAYLISRMPESKFRSAIAYILHQADFMASVVELTINPVEQPKSKQFAISKETTQKNPTTHQQAAKNKALSNIQSDGLKNAMTNFFND